MASFNQLTIVGNLTRDAETTFTDSGDQKTSFTLAVNDPFSKAENSTMFYTCTAWRKQAELLAGLTKGQSLLVIGRHSTREWKGRDEQNHTSNEVSIKDFTFLSPRNAVALDEPSF